jgi:hypothetical protein
LFPLRPRELPVWKAALGWVAAIVVSILFLSGLCQTGVRAPETITVEGRPYSLEHGHIFVFFFHPQCMHCFEAARRMSQLHWGSTRIVAVPVDQPQFAAQFLAETGLKAVVSTDFESMKKVFGYTTYPFGVALENGREKAALTNFEEPEPMTSLRQLGMAY